MAPDASGAGSLVVAAPAGSYGTGTPQQPLTIATASDPAWPNPTVISTSPDSIGTIYPVIPPQGSSYRLWSAEISVIGYTSTSSAPSTSTISTFVRAILWIAKSIPPSAETEEYLYPETTLITSCMASAFEMATSGDEFSLYAADSQFVDLGGMVIPPNYGLFTSTQATCSLTVPTNGASHSVVTYDIP